MNIRLARDYDFNQIKTLHEKFFDKDFPFPDLSKLINAYVVEDEGKIITFGGARVLLELVAITDMHKSPIKRFDALSKLLTAIALNSSEKKYDQLHCFILKDENWLRCLESNGFRETNGKSLVIDI